MKRHIIFLTIIFGVQVAFGQDICFDWLKLEGQNGRNGLSCIVTDAQNNIVVGGYFEHTINVDGKILMSKGQKDYFLAKYDSLGNNIWIKSGGGLRDDYIVDLVRFEDKIYLLGAFSDTILLEGKEFISGGQMNYFIGELVNDSILGLTRCFGKGLVIPAKLHVNNRGYYVTGTYRGELIFDTVKLVSDGSWEYEWPGTDTIYIYHEHLFLIKYDTDNNIEWYKDYKNIRSLSIASDNASNTYLLAENLSNCIIEDSILLEDNLFMVKLDDKGNYLWHLTGGPSGQITQPYDLILSENHIYITGHIAGNNLFIGNENIVETSWYDAFVCKCDTSGSLIWFNQIGVGSWRENIGPHHNFGNSIILSKDTIIIAGHFLEDIDFGSTILNSQGAHDLFYAKYLFDGSFIEAGQYIVPGWSSAEDVAIDDTGNVYIAGYSFEKNTISNETQFMLLGKIDCISNSSTSVLGKNASNGFVVYPIPTSSQINLIFQEEYERFIYIIDPLGKTILTTRTDARETKMDVSNLSNGIYILVINDHTSLLTRKFLKTD